MPGLAPSSHRLFSFFLSYPFCTCFLYSMDYLPPVALFLLCPPSFYFRSRDECDGVSHHLGWFGRTNSCRGYHLDPKPRVIEWSLAIIVLSSTRGHANTHISTRTGGAGDAVTDVGVCWKLPSPIIVFRCNSCHRDWPAFPVGIVLCTGKSSDVPGNY